MDRQFEKQRKERAVELIEEARRITESQAVHCCQRCGVKLETDEFVCSQKAFQRSFCKICFDEVFMERRNFETKVELQKTRWNFPFVLCIRW